MNVDRRQFLKLMAALGITGAASVLWDANVNGGRPADADADDDEPQ